MPQPPQRSTLRPVFLAASAVSLGLIALFAFISARPSPSSVNIPDTNAPAPQSPTASSDTSAPDSPQSSPASSATPFGIQPTPTSPSTNTTPLTPESIAKNELQLLAFNKLASSTNDADFRRLVDDANMAATKGGDEQEQHAIARLIESKDYLAAANALLAIAERPGGVTTFTKTDLADALRKEGRAAEAQVLEAEIATRTLSTLERMEDLELGQAAPVVFSITFWRANQYLPRGSPQWRRAFESLARVGATIPDGSTATQAGYVRSLGAWARQTLDKFDAQENQTR